MTTPTQALAIISAGQRRADIAFDLSREIIKGENSPEAAAKIKVLAAEAAKAEVVFWANLSMAHAGNLGFCAAPRETVEDFADDARIIAQERSYGPIVTSASPDLTPDHLTAADLGVGRYARNR